VMVGAAFDVTEEWTVKSFNLAAVTAVNNKANLRFRIKFVGTGADGASGNHRIDNITMEGTPPN
jgi:hypothetical protein